MSLDPSNQTNAEHQVWQPSLPSLQGGEKVGALGNREVRAQWGGDSWFQDKLVEPNESSG